MTMPIPDKRAARRFLGCVTRFCADARGGTAIEYTLIAGLTFLTIVGALRFYANRMGAMYDYIAAAVINN